MPNTEQASKEAGSPQRRLPVLMGPAVIVLATLAAYWNSFDKAFVFDDILSIQQNPTIRSLRPIWRVLSPPAQGETVTARPMVNLSLAINYAINGLETWSYHAFNLAIHVLAALTLYGIVRRTLLLPRLRDRFGRSANSLALAVAIIWTLHPLQTDSVTYVVQRAEAMMGLFYFLTLYCFIRAAGSAKAAPWCVLAVAACGLGMVSKEVIVTAPVIVLLYDRTFIAGSFKHALQRRWGLYAGLAATWGLLAYVQATGGLVKFAEGLTAWQYARTQFGVIVHYLRLCFWPHPLCIDYGWPIARTAGQVLPEALVIAGLLAVTLWALWRRMTLAFAGAWFFVILAPTSSVVPVAYVDDMAFEHRMYLPLAGVVVLVVMCAHLAWRRWAPRADRPRGGVWRAAPVAVLLAVAAALGLRTAMRNRDYQSELAIWQKVLDVRPNNARAHNGMGLVFGRKRKLDEAVAHFTRALQIRPNYADVHDNLGVVLLQQDKPDEAIDHFRMALDIDPQLAEAHNNWGYALITRKDGKDLDGAVEHLREALRLNPRLATPHYNLGVAFEGKGNDDKAVNHYEQALKLQPDLTAARLNLAKVLARQGKLDQAAQHYQEILRRHPPAAEVHNRLGLIMARQGKIDQAIASFRQAVRFEGDHGPAHYNLAEALASKNQWAEAIPSYERALQLKPDRPDKAETCCRLAAAYAALGRIDQAARQYRQALRLNSDHVEAANNLAWLLATHASLAGSDPAEAVALAQRACRLTGDVRPGFLDTLAAAYANKGEFAKAVETAQRAIELAEASGQAELAEEIRTRLELYRGGKPFRWR